MKKFSFFGVLMLGTLLFVSFVFADDYVPKICSQYTIEQVLRDKSENFKNYIKGQLYEKGLRDNQDKGVFERARIINKWAILLNVYKSTLKFSRCNILEKNSLGDKNNSQITANIPFCVESRNTFILDESKFTDKVPSNKFWELTTATQIVVDDNGCNFMNNQETLVEFYKNIASIITNPTAPQNATASR